MGESDQEEFARELLATLDGAVSSGGTLAPEMEGAREIAADATRSLKERLEAYEDIIDSEVGDTNLTRARNIERETKLRHFYLKLEGGNPTGTQKDRIAFAQVMDAMRLLPASTAGLLALLERHEAELLPSDRYVAVITGRRS